MANANHTYVQYHVPVDGDSEEHPNVFLVKRPLKELRLADVQSASARRGAGRRGKGRARHGGRLRPPPPWRSFRAVGGGPAPRRLAASTRADPCLARQPPPRSLALQAFPLPGTYFFRAKQAYGKTHGACAQSHPPSL